MLKERCCLIAGYNLFLSKETSNILSVFRDRNISVIVLKGLSLAESVYSHIGKRPMADIDLLVRKKDTQAALLILSELGYSLNPGNSGYSYTKDEVVRTCIDLHTDIACFSEEEIWKGLREVESDDFSIPTLSLEHTLIFLCYHMAIGHAYPYRRWLEDIHRFISRYNQDIDWQKVVIKVKSSKLSILCYFSLIKVKEVFKTGFGDEIVEAFKSRYSFKETIFKMFFLKAKPVAYAPYILQALFDSPRHVLLRVFPPLSVLKMRYQISTFGAILWYMIRPFRLIFQAAKAFSRLLKN